MNAYTQLLYYIKGLGDNDVNVNTITQGNWTDIDLDKKNIFPLLHASIGNASFPSLGVVRLDVQIGAFDIRDINKDINTDKYFSNDNEVDNLNETLTILNRIWLQMYKDFEDKGITTSDFPSLEQFTESRKNLLDGWIMTLTVDLPNTDVNLCSQP